MTIKNIKEYIAKKISLPTELEYIDDKIAYLIPLHIRRAFFRTIKLIIIFTLLFGLAFILSVSMQKKAENLNKETQNSIVGETEANPYDQFYFNNLAYELIMEVQEGMLQDEIIQNLIDLEYREEDINFMISELGVDWDTSSFTNTRSEYYKEFYEDGTIWD